MKWSTVIIQSSAMETRKFQSFCGNWTFLLGKNKTETQEKEMTCSKLMSQQDWSVSNMNFGNPFLLQLSITQVLLMRYVSVQSHSYHSSLMKQTLLFVPNHWFHTMACFFIVWWDSLYFRCSLPILSEHPMVRCFPYLIRNVIVKVLLLSAFSLPVSNSYHCFITWVFYSSILCWHSRHLPSERLTLQLLCNSQPLEMHPLTDDADFPNAVLSI